MSEISPTTETPASSVDQEIRIGREVRPEAPHAASGRWVWVAIAAALGVVIWIAVAHRSTTSGASASARDIRSMATPVVATVARRGDIGVYFTGLGAVTPISTVTVKSRVDGQLMNVYFKEGQSVRQGDRLAEIDSRPYQVQLTQAEGQLAKDEATLENARVDLVRYQTLIARNAVTAQQLATQKALVMQDEGAVKVDQGQVDSAKLNLMYCHLTSPIGGRVGLRLVDPGNIVHAGDTNGLMVITQVEPISIVFTISEDQVPAVMKKMRAGQLRVEAWDRDLKNKLAEGRLTTLDNQIDPTTGTLKLRATFDNKDDALFPNQFVNARLLVEEKHDATLVSNAAIQRNSQATFVYVVKPDQTATVRPVTVGITEGGFSEIVSGLVPDEEVVTTGVDKLQEGSKVKAQLGGDNSRSAHP